MDEHQVVRKWPFPGEERPRVGREGGEQRVTLGRDKSITKGELVAFWLATTTVSVGLFTFAVSQSRLVVGTLSVLIAAIVGMIAVFVPIFYLENTRANFRDSAKMLLLSLVLLAVGLAAAVTGFREESQLLTALGVYFAVHGGAFLADWFNQRVEPGSDAIRQTVSVVGANVAIVITTALATWLDGFGPAAVAVALVWFVAIAVLKLAVVQYVEAEGEQRELRLNLTWGTTVAALVVAPILLFVSSGFVAIAWATSLLVSGLSVLGLLLHNDVALPDSLGGQPALAPRLPNTGSDQQASLTERGQSFLGAIAAVALVGSFLVFLGLTEETSSAVAAVVVVAIIGAFFVLPGETIMVGVLFALLVVWVAADTDSASIDIDNAASITAEDWSGEWVVAFGDSFISGEGAPRYYEGTNSPGTNDCRRAPTSFPRRVGNELGLPVQSFACSGAVVANVLQGGRVQEPDSPLPFAAGRTQLDAAAEWLALPESPSVDDITVVLVNIGGNDAGFTDLIVACLTPGADCEEVAAPFFDRSAGLDVPLAELYSQIRELFPSPRVLVTLAPDVVGNNGVDCSLVISDAEGEFIREVGERLNERTRSAVSAFNAQRGTGEVPIELVESGSSLVGHELCGDERYVNWLRLTPPDGAFSSAVNPKNWKNGSLHPGPNGHCVVALLVLDTLDLPGGQRDFGDCERPSGTDESVPLTMPLDPPICAENPQPLEPDACSDAWVGQALSDSASAMLIAAALAVVGGLAIARGLSSRTRTKPFRYLDRVWSLVSDIWLDYDRVHGGAKALAKEQEPSSPV